MPLTNEIINYLMLDEIEVAIEWAVISRVRRIVIWSPLFFVYEPLSGVVPKLGSHSVPVVLFALIFLFMNRFQAWFLSWLPAFCPCGSICTYFLLPLCKDEVFFF